MVLEPIQLKEEERLFYGIGEEFGCIGYLRGDFGKSGKNFYNVWFSEECHKLNDGKFKAVLDKLINDLREKEQMLGSRSEMLNYCLPQKNCKIRHSCFNLCWGFRILTQDYAFYVRCTINPGAYDFYVFCYDKEILMNKLAKDRGLTRYCYAYLPTTGEEIRIDFAEGGYTPYRKQGNGRAANEMNRELGITPAQAEAMKVGSMFGWDVPGADPRNYDENGKPIRKKDDREER